MSSVIILILHINSDNKWPRDFSEALPEGVSQDTGSNRNEKNITATCVYYDLYLVAIFYIYKPIHLLLCVLSAVHVYSHLSS